MENQRFQNTKLEQDDLYVFVILLALIEQTIIGGKT